MDEFLSDIYFLVFREWVKGQFKSYTVDGDDINYDSECYKVRMGFHEEFNIIEFEVTNKKHDNVEFYLHFQMQNLNHALNLFNQMKLAIESIKSRKQINVLLSCTGGLTTSFFAEELNNAANSMNLDYHFDAVGFTDLISTAQNYNVILLAPQIAYQRPKIQAVFQDKIVLDIPGQLFAKYDAPNTIRLVEKTLTEKKLKNDNNINISLDGKLNNNKKILVISAIRNRHHSFMNYRVYDKDKILDKRKIVKNRFQINDFYDLFNSVFARWPEINEVAIAMPGMVDSSGYVTGSFDDMNYDRAFKRRFPGKKFYIYNDTNAAVVGLSMEHDECSNVCLYHVGKNNSVGGMASVINKQLVIGKEGIAGEIRWYLKGQDQEEKYIKKAKTIEGSVEVIAHNLLPLICIVGPELIGISSDMVPYVDDVKTIIETKIPKKYLPEFVKVEDISDYMMYGLLKLVA